LNHPPDEHPAPVKAPERMQWGIRRRLRRMHRPFSRRADTTVDEVAEVTVFRGAIGVRHRVRLAVGPLLDHRQHFVQVGAQSRVEVRPRRHLAQQAEPIQFIVGVAGLLDELIGVG